MIYSSPSKLQELLSTMAGGKQLSQNPNNPYAPLYTGHTGQMDYALFPGLQGVSEADIGALLYNLAQAPPTLPTAVSSPYTDILQKELMTPTYGPTTESETALLNSLMDLTGGRSAARGLGPPTAGGLAQTIAPTLVDMRERRISNLSQALGTDISNQLTQRGQDIQGALGGYSSQLQGLLELAGYSMPQLIAQGRVPKPPEPKDMFGFNTPYGGISFTY